MISYVILIFCSYMYKNFYLLRVKFPPKLCQIGNWGSFPIDAGNITGYLSTGKELLYWKAICCCDSMSHNLKGNPCNPCAGCPNS